MGIQNPVTRVRLLPRAPLSQHPPYSQSHHREFGASQQKTGLSQISLRHPTTSLSCSTSTSKPYADYADINHKHMEATHLLAITLNSALEGAADFVGYMPHASHTKTLFYNDHKQDVKALRTKLNRLLHQIQEHSKALAGAFIDEKLAIIEQSNRSTQMFETTRVFRQRSSLTSLCDSTGKYILNRQDAGTKIKQHFKDQFSDPKHTSVTVDGLKHPLNSPITADEIDCAFRCLHNGRAPGPDAISAELLKYGSDLLAQPLADITNHGLSTGDNIHPGDRYKERFHILGIDLSRGFDTVNCDKPLSVLKTILDDDEIRLIRVLLRPQRSPSDTAII
ncbi:hypothetical protein P3T76_002845 [Phytophthora citrophthora]|uniref:Reverse transcriptase domain-containing protein n=1 Tax=Phytophthora citrophthora TaxID=4793 RepID=A0AAD9GW02_9STRA|nr:hypothetical protein P3T76_002845 [Phytophthora citrophthora]